MLRRFLRPQTGSSHRAFTLIEILVTMAIITLLISLLLVVISRVRQGQRSVQCTNNLRGLANAFTQYAIDNGQRYPYPAGANRSWEQLLLKYYQGTFACPSDQEIAPAVGSSYDWRDTGNPQTTLAGRSMAESLRQDAVLVFEALPGWHARRRINVARLDGSAESITEETCFQDLHQPVTTPGAR